MNFYMFVSLKLLSCMCAGPYTQMYLLLCVMTIVILTPLVRVYMIIKTFMIF